MDIKSKLFLSLPAIFLLLGCVVNDPIQELAAQLTSDRNSDSAEQVDTKSDERSQIIDLKTDDRLIDLIDGAEGNVLLDFHAEWCRPCKKQGEVLTSLTKTAATHKARIIKIDVDKHPELARQFRVTSLPTLFMVKNGAVNERLTGLTSSKRITELLTR